MSRRNRDLDELKRLAVLGHFQGRSSYGRGPMFRDPILGGGRGRRRRGDIRVALLLLLAEEPRNGYQLMQTIEELSGGRWRPSPGSIYPTLAQLEDQGLVRATEREGTKLFEITDVGRQHLQERQEQTPPWLDEDEPEAYTDLRGQIKQLHVAAMQVAHAGDERQISAAARTLAEARRTIYRILADEGISDAEEGVSDAEPRMPRGEERPSDAEKGMPGRAEDGV